MVRWMAVLFVLAACGSPEADGDMGPGDLGLRDQGGSADEGIDDAGAPGPLYSVGTIVAEPTGRSFYVQTTNVLEGSFGLEGAIEVPGNSRHWAYEGSVYVGMGEEPTLVRYTPNAEGALEETGRLSFLGFGSRSMPPAAVFIAPDKAYMVLFDALTVVIFDPTEMAILGDIDLTSLGEEGLISELWFPTLHAGRLYLPVRPV
ncbi:MAG: hypothetical protein AAGH15_24810, partial [Myxococcota bacterium]